MPTPLRLGLALGAGGVVGASYLVGALVAIQELTGWDPAFAAETVGTSAGAFVAAIAAAGVPYGVTYARCTGDAGPPGVTYPVNLHDLGARMDRPNEGPWFARYPPRARVPRPFLASPRLLASAFAGSLAGDRAGALTLGLLGEGWLSNLPSIGAVIQTGLPTGWSKQPLWVVTLDLDRGCRAVLGAPGFPKPDLHQAISAATAIPGVFAPVLIDGHRHCDAALSSPANLDVFAGLGLDAVLCINPLSGVPRETGSRSLPRRFVGRVRSFWSEGWDEQLARERRAVEAAGTRVHLLEPSAEDRAHFPVNPMDLGARADVMRRARATTMERLRTEEGLRPIVELLRRQAGEAERNRDYAQESL